MNTNHWTNTDFLNRLYGAGRADDFHLESCTECRARWEALLRSRHSLLDSDAPIPADFLARQREQMERRIERSRRTVFFAKWSPAVAIAGMALCAVLWKLPNERPSTTPYETAASADSQLMADIYRTVYDVEPDVVEPLHGLFQDSKPEVTKQ